MSNFQATLNFLDLSENTPPANTTLLFYNQPDNYLSRGWYDLSGKLVLVGSQFTPTHFAEYAGVVEQQSGRLRFFSVKNESAQGDTIEVEASSHKDAVTRYRQQLMLTGYAKLITTDMEAMFGQRGNATIKMEHDTRSFIQPRIMYRNTYVGGDGWTYYSMRVTLAANCPTCGQPRGPLTPGRVIEDGEYFHLDTWHNECGHQDSYKDAYLEYQQLKADGLLDKDGQPVAGEVIVLAA